jgi:hypothetical protein
MAQLSKEILVQTDKKLVIKLNYDASTQLPVGGLTCTISPSDANNFLSYLDPSKVNLDIGKAIWSIQAGGSLIPVTFALAWGVSGSLTGQDSFYMSSYGQFEANQLGFNFRNPITGSARTNTINIRNVAPVLTGNASTIILELNKTTGFGISGTQW